MSNSRDEILRRIREGLPDSLLPDSVRDHPTADLPSANGGVEQFVAEAEAVAAQVIRVPTAQDAAQAIADLCVERGWNSLLGWTWDQIDVAGLEDAIAAASIDVVHDGNPATLADIPAGITGSDGGLADTGTLVLRHGPGRSPLASLLPPIHIALLDAETIFPDMAAYWRSLSTGSAAHVRETSNLVFITGPSRTGDIEQTLTLGVHGPVEVIIILWGGE